jgi:hypothetical protein
MYSAGLFITVHFTGTTPTSLTKNYHIFISNSKTGAYEPFNRDFFERIGIMIEPENSIDSKIITFI